jgi:hypothetical protein
MPDDLFRHEADALGINRVGHDVGRAAVHPSAQAIGRHEFHRAQGSNRDRPARLLVARRAGHEDLGAPVPAPGPGAGAAVVGDAGAVVAEPTLPSAVEKLITLARDPL